MPGYVVRLALMSLWRNRAMSGVAIVTTAILLLLLSGFLILLTSLNASVRALEAKVNVVVYLRDDVGQSSLDALLSQLRAEPAVLSVTYTTKDEALSQLKTDFSDRPGVVEAVEGNPLPASLNVTLRDPSQAAPFAAGLQNLPGVDEVDFKQDTVQRLLTVASFIRVGGLGVMTGITIAVIVIMVNIARMGIYARRQEIEIMRLVGATDWFVRWPFVAEGMLCGLLAALLTVGMMAFAYHRVVYSFSSLLSFLPMQFDPLFIYKLGLSALLMGVAVGGGGSLVAVRRFWEAER